MASSFAYLTINNGVNNASVYPYRETKLSCRYNSNYNSIAVRSFVNLPFGDEEVLKNALAAVGPISVNVLYTDLTFVFKAFACSQLWTHHKIHSTAMQEAFISIPTAVKFSHMQS
jgi:hypothetical protein